MIIVVSEDVAQNAIEWRKASNTTVASLGFLYSLRPMALETKVQRTI